MFALRALAVVVAALFGAFLWIYFLQDLPYRAAPRQPISFSHRIHYERGIPCAFCHMDAPRSTFAGIPSVLKCMGCHRVIIPQYPEIQKLHAYWRAQAPIPWKRVTWIPDYVRFTHQPHIAAGIQCQTCHGSVGSMDRVREVVNFNMNTCITCHRSLGARTDCFGACHH